jgi:hypothetical protein
VGHDVEAFAAGGFYERLKADFFQPVADEVCGRDERVPGNIGRRVEVERDSVRLLDRFFAAAPRVDFEGFKLDE